MAIPRAPRRHERSGRSDLNEEHRGVRHGELGAARGNPHPRDATPVATDRPVCPGAGAASRAQPGARIGGAVRGRRTDQQCRRQRDTPGARHLGAAFHPPVGPLGAGRGASHVVCRLLPAQRSCVSPVVSLTARLRRVIFTGPPGSGKTTLLSVLWGMGIEVVPEAATDLITQMQERGQPGAVDRPLVHGAHRCSAAAATTGCRRGSDWCDRVRPFAGVHARIGQAPRACGRSTSS